MSARELANEALRIHQNYPPHVRERQQSQMLARLARCVLELDKRYCRALSALEACYKAGHREGRQDGPTTEEAMEMVSDILSNEKLEKIVFGDKGK